MFEALDSKTEWDWTKVITLTLLLSPIYAQTWKLKLLCLVLYPVILVFTLVLFLGSVGEIVYRKV